MALTRSGKNAVSPKTCCGAIVCSSEPEKYADVSAPKLWHDQQSDCSAPEEADGSSRARSTTSESTTTSDTATPSEATVEAKTACAGVCTTVARLVHAAEPSTPARMR